MPAGSNDQHPTATSPPLKQPASVHRAVIYSACAPGWGDIYVGSRFKGYATLSVFLICAAWATWSMALTAKAVVGQFFDSLEGITPFVMPDLPAVELAISVAGIYFTWLWGMLSAADTASAQRRKTGVSAQASVGWAVAMSWFCPGSGLVYAEDRRLGFMIFGAYILGFLLIVPAYQQLFLGLHELVKSGQLSPNNPFAVIGFVHGLIVRLDYSFGKIFQESTKCFAVAASLAALKQGPLAADKKWLTPTPGYGIALLGLGWLCPGSGQLLQGRNRIGWGFLAGYCGSRFLIVPLLGEGFIGVETADQLAWLAVIVQWSSMIEAPVAMVMGKRSGSH
ncbi:hypothetical protein D1AOALGA4SA_5194 [Olavius algarvensis Delta 1 endosymbiont]|nr:hypothetical protein D1AOALGA4SA_5194 [Olavius algarvensis Delta 1 endosymbiont]